MLTKHAFFLGMYRFYLRADVSEASMVVEPFNINTKLNGIVKSLKNGFASIAALVAFNGMESLAYAA